MTAADVSAVFGTDYSSPSAPTMAEPVNFVAGDNAVTVTYSISKDTLIEDTETFTLTLALTGTTQTDMFAAIISPTVSTVYINDCTGIII